MKSFFHHLAPGPIKACSGSAALSRSDTLAGVLKGVVVGQAHLSHKPPFQQILLGDIVQPVSSQNYEKNTLDPDHLDSQMQCDNLFRVYIKCLNLRSCFQIPPLSKSRKIKQVIVKQDGNLSINIGKGHKVPGRRRFLRSHPPIPIKCMIELNALWEWTFIHPQWICGGDFALFAPSCDLYGKESSETIGNLF